MNFWRNKLDPFTKLTTDLGPIYVDRMFECVSLDRKPRDWRNSHQNEKILLYLAYLEKISKSLNTNQKKFSNFYKGYFYQELTKYQFDSKERQFFMKQAVDHYNLYLDKADVKDQVTYFAQWQVGLLLEKLNYPWVVVQNLLSNACKTDPKRGETVKKLVDHYISVRDWPIAYEHSLLSINCYYANNPIAIRHWYVDPDSYNWKVLDNHAQICLNISNQAEAEDTYVKLLHYVLNKSDEFDDTQIKQISGFRKKVGGRLSLALND